MVMIEVISDDDDNKVNNLLTIMFNTIRLL